MLRCSYRACNAQARGTPFPLLASGTGPIREAIIIRTDQSREALESVHQDQLKMSFAWIL